MVKGRQARAATKLIFWEKGSVLAGPLGKGRYLFRSSSGRGKSSYLGQELDYKP
jgi:hypothetical protein